MDLGANELVTFWKVTFPLILPGVMAAALLAFSLSIDDFVITNFTAGHTVTFPMYIYGANRVGVPVQVNVIGTMIFIVAVGFVAVTTWLQSRANRPARPTKPQLELQPGADRILATTSEA
jgi:spermidine/putrescine transport system permease protein